MFDNQATTSSKDIYFSLCKSKQSLFPANRAEDVVSMITTAQRELFFDFGSELLDACYSVWSRYAKKVGIRDCTYLPRTFRLVYTEAPYELSGYDAFMMFKLLADALADEKIDDAANKWLAWHLGRKYNYSNPRDNCLDAQLKRIDDELTQQHRRILQQYRDIADVLKNDPTSLGVIQAARLQANGIIEQTYAQSATIIAQAKALEQQGLKLRNEGEKAARKMYDAAEAAERLRTEQAQELLNKAREDAQIIKQDADEKASECLKSAQKQADGILEDCKRQTEELLARARAKAQEIKQNALDEKHKACNESLKTGMDLVVQQFIQTQDAMRNLEAQFAQSQLLKIFDTFYSLYDLIDVNRQSLQELPDEYSYICENMDTFLEVIQEGLADFGIQTIISAPNCPFNGKLHTVQGSTMFDPATAILKRSVRPGFVNQATGNVLQKELVELIRS